MMANLQPHVRLTTGARYAIPFRPRVPGRAVAPRRLRRTDSGAVRSRPPNGSPSRPLLACGLIACVVAALSLRYVTIGYQVSPEPAVQSFALHRTRLCVRWWLISRPKRRDVQGLEILYKRHGPGLRTRALSDGSQSPRATPSSDGESAPKRSLPHRRLGRSTRGGVGEYRFDRGLRAFVILVADTLRQHPPLRPSRCRRRWESRRAGQNRPSIPGRG